MTAKNLYVRDGLAVTRDGIVDPAVEVELWLDEIKDFIEDLCEPCPACALTGGYCGGMSGHRNCGVPEGAIGGGPQQAYDILALVGKIGRVRPELIEQADGTEECRRAQALVEKFGAELAQRAIHVLNPPAWLETVGGLEKGLDDLPDPVEEVDRVIDLLEDLDDAELVVAMAHKFGVTDAGLEAGVEKCVDWLCQHTGLFLAANCWVQAVGAGMSPELEDEDYDLAVTALKFCHFLDAAEAAEAELTLENVKPLPAEVVAGLFKAYEESKKT